MTRASRFGGVRLCRARIPGRLVATAGSPGQIWYHDRQDIYAVGTPVTTGPIGLDVIGLANGNVVLASTIPLAAGCVGAKYAVWVPGLITYVAISCGDTGFVILEETTLVSE